MCVCVRRAPWCLPRACRSRGSTRTSRSSHPRPDRATAGTTCAARVYRLRNGGVAAIYGNAPRCASMRPPKRCMLVRCLRAGARCAVQQCSLRAAQSSRCALVRPAAGPRAALHPARPGPPLPLVQQPVPRCGAPALDGRGAPLRLGLVREHVRQHVLHDRLCATDAPQSLPWLKLLLPIGVSDRFVVSYFGIRSRINSCRNTAGSRS
jgi:hypothetical protein